MTRDTSVGVNAPNFPSAADTARFRAGFWRLADPKISLASFASIFLAACLAGAAGPIHWGWLALTILGVFAIEVAKNASGEVFDFDSGTDLAVRPEDRSPFSGGKRVLVDGLLTRRQTWALSVAAYGLGILAGVSIVIWKEPGVLWLGMTGVALAFLYHAPPLSLSYRGWGELAVALCYGPLLCAGVYLVQRGEITASVVAASLPLGLLIGAFLWINEFPDYRADREAGKRNLVVRIGRIRASRAFAAICGCAVLCIVFAPIAGVPRGVLAGLGCAPFLWRAASRVLRHPEETEKIIPAQAATLFGFVAFAVLAGIGILLTT